ncbi:gas vesicle protein [Streptomyces lincolnensis]|uniref:gas vesicle protein n=1 Tax=Streptomyces lincolnensis TaxID=1915 RepID=UPI0037D28D88
MTNTKGSSESQNSRNPRKGEERDTERDVAENRPSPMEVLRDACAQLGELTGMSVESASAFEQTEDGWSLEVEVLELARVPDTMSLLASYRVDVDSRGQLTGYRRVRRYERGRADPHGRSGGR